MSINTIPISQRNAPYSPQITANGSFTLPQYAFIPHPDLQQLSSGRVLAPTPGMQSAFFALPAGIAARAMPQANTPSVYGIRAIYYKQSP